MRVATRKDFFASLIMYKLIRMKEPHFFRPSLYNANQISLHAVHEKTLIIDISSVSYNWGINSFQVKYDQLWNAIPPCIRDIYSRQILIDLIDSIDLTLKVYNLKFTLVATCMYHS